MPAFAVLKIRTSFYNVLGYGAALKNFKPALLLRGSTIFRGGDTGIPSLGTGCRLRGIR